jgi:hypothetical protein
LTSVTAQNMSQPYKVTFGKVARTLVYEDPECRFVFTFEQDLDGVTHLEHHIPQQQYAPRYRIAFERTKEFIESRGRQVKIHGDYWISKNPLPSDVTERIRLELSQNSDLPPFSFVVEDCLITPERAQFRSGAGAWPWILWTVLAVPESSVRVVFDECSTQFGLVENGNFEGFNGTFVQTLNDLSKALGESSYKDS